METEKMKVKHGRATHEQLERYVAFYRENPEMGVGKNCPRSPQQLQNLWSQLADELNSLRGPTRTAEKWKETLGVWKSQLRTRARRLKMSNRLTGGGPYCKPMGEFEERALATFGTLAVDGAGFGSSGLRVSTLIVRLQFSSGSTMTVAVNLETVLNTAVLLPAATALMEPSINCPTPPQTSPGSTHSEIDTHFTSAVPPLSPVQSTSVAQLESPVPSPPAALLSPVISLSSPTLMPGVTPIDSEIENAAVLETGAARLSRNDRNRLINSLIEKIANRNVYEEQRQRREEEQRQEHRETIEAIQTLTSCVSELVKVLKPN